MPAPALSLCVASFLGAVALSHPLQRHQAPFPAVPDAEGQGSEELRIGRPPGATVAYFVLEQEGIEEPIGLARWTHTPLPEEGGEDLELDIVLFEERTRLLHCESTRFGRRKLIWREFRPRTGRTILLEGEGTEGFQGFETTGGEVRRRRFEPVHPLFPLGLIEEVRRGRTYLGTFSVFQPLAGAFERQRLSTEVADGLAPRSRELSLHGPDGALRASYRFSGPELVSFARTDGGPRSRRVTEAEYETRLAQRGPAPRELLGGGGPRIGGASGPQSSLPPLVGPSESPRRSGSQRW